MQYKIGMERIYNDLFDIGDVVLWDVLFIESEQFLTLEFISTNSKYRQGIRLAIDVGDGYIESNNIKSKGIQLWEDTCPKKVNIKCISSAGKLSIYNIYDKGADGREDVQSQMASCGMLIEKKGNAIQYKCNDTGFCSVFDKLIFQIELK